jgi:hypothetical protein
MAESRRQVDIEALFRDGKEIDRALKLAVQDALRLHKLFGNPVPTRQDGKGGVDRALGHRGR